MSERLVAIVLAAGRGERFGGGKLAAPLGGKPLLYHAMAAALASPAQRVLVIGRPRTALPADFRLSLIELPSTALSESLRAGLAAAAEAEAALIYLGDMPLVPHGIPERLIAALAMAWPPCPSSPVSRGIPFCWPGAVSPWPGV